MPQLSSQKMTTNISCEKKEGKNNGKKKRNDVTYEHGQKFNLLDTRTDFFVTSAASLTEVLGLLSSTEKKM